MIAMYIEGFYNPERRHSTLVYLSPVWLNMLQGMERISGINVSVLVPDNLVVRLRLVYSELLHPGAKCVWVYT